MARTMLISQVERRRRRKFIINAVFRYTILTVVALVMIYPIIWLVGATFKTNNEIIYINKFHAQQNRFYAVYQWLENQNEIYLYHVFFKHIQFRYT
ncbi:hypothetical protein [Lacrimispora indolis]|uniref:hypothetical protein n=1 Tax=Lacrimispora indolis TaxID=69825 RepID=UPI0004B801C1|nr:hypothetical protein [Lacrimispora indolis]